MKKRIFPNQIAVCLSETAYDVDFLALFGSNLGRRLLNVHTRPNCFELTDQVNTHTYKADIGNFIAWNIWSLQQER